MSQLTKIEVLRHEKKTVTKVDHYHCRIHALVDLVVLRHEKKTVTNVDHYHCRIHALVDLVASQLGLNFLINLFVYLAQCKASIHMFKTTSQKVPNLNIFKY